MARADHQPATASGRASGKVILLGEHAVVYGRPAIAATIDRGVDVVLTSAPGPARFVTEDDPRLASALARAVELVGCDADGYAIRVRSDLPRAMGLGSSAALSVALVRALADRSARRLRTDDVNAIAFELEKIFHGTPSGIDNSIVAYGGLIGFHRDSSGGARVRELGAGRLVPLVVALGRAPRQTKSVVSGLRERWQSDPAAYESRFDEIGWLVADAELALTRGDLGELGILMNTNQGLLHGLGVSTDELEAMVSLARTRGALGAKLTGGGGGGAVICLCPDEPERLIDSFARTGWQAFVSMITNGGRGADGRDDTASTERRDAARG